MRSSKRLIWKLFGAGLAVLIVAVIVHPWLVMRTAIWLAEREGVSVESWEVEGYRGYVLHGLAYDGEAGSFRTGTVRVRQPAGWVWTVLRESPPEEPYLMVSDWWFEPGLGVEPDPKQSPMRSLGELYQTLVELEPLVRRWAGWIELRDGRVAADTAVFDAPILQWKQGRLNLEGGWASEGLRATLSGPLPGPWDLTAQVDRVAETLHLSVVPAIDGDDLVVDWEGEVATAFASGSVVLQNDRTPWYPASSWLRVRLGVLDGGDFGLPQLAVDRGKLDATWEHGAWSAEGTVYGSWLEGDLYLPVELQLTADGDQQRAQLRELHALAPWIEAELSHPIAWSITDRRFEEAFALSMRVDLEALNVDGVSGQLTGSLQMAPDLLEGEIPPTEFNVNADGVRIGDHAVEAFEARGRFSYPMLTVDGLSARLPNGSAVSGSGAVEVHRWILRDVAASGVLHSDDVPVLAESHPDGAIHFEVRAEGPREAIRHEGMAHTENVHFPPLHPMDLRVEWSGEGIGSTRFGLEAVQSEAVWRFSGVALRDPGAGWGIELESGRISSEGTDLWSLSEPSTISWRQDNSEPWIFAIEGLEWTGDAGLVGRLQLDWRPDGPREVSGQVADLDVRRFQPLFETDLPEASLRGLTAELHHPADAGAALSWGVDFDAVLRGDPLPPDDRIQLELAMGGDASGARIERASVVGRHESFLDGAGTLPLALVWTDGRPAVRIVPEIEADLRLRVLSRPVLVRLVHKYTGVDLGDPDIVMRLQGSPDRPKGALEASFRTLSIRAPGRGEPLQFHDLEVGVTADPNAISVERFRFRFQDEWFELSGSLPMGTQDWRALWEDRVAPDWKAASARLATERFRMEAISAFLPDLVARTGFFRGELNLDPGPRIHGFVELRGVATRPLATGTSLREINGRVSFDDTRAELSGFTAYLERHPVSVSGWLDFGDWREPEAMLELSGENLPFIRQQDLIVRGDADLTFRKSRGSPGVLRGDLRLRESLLMREFHGITRPGVAAAAMRPPFFSIDEPAVADWVFDLRVRGDRFMRVQTPFFSGRLSADFQLLGTFAEPMLIGESSVADGVVAFPFANVRIDQGSVRLTRRDPYDPQIRAYGHARTMGYDINMEVSGSAYEPVIRFSSNPPLSQDAILLLLSAGVLPASDESGPGAGAVGQRLAIFLGKGIAGDLFAGVGDGWTQDLTIESTGGSSATGRETYRIEYRISESFSLIGENNEFDEYNAGVRWRFYAR